MGADKLKSCLYILSSNAATTKIHFLSIDRHYHILWIHTQINTNATAKTSAAIPPIKPLLDDDPGGVSVKPWPLILSSTLQYH